jgi:pantoate--beta-alanine ligase
MIIFKQASELSGYIREQKNKGLQIGFAPTMGALHEGHLALVNESRRENGITVSSIFINPTQFNNAEDFRLYPVTIEKDIEKLLSAGCDALFLPSVKEVYPPSHQKKHYGLGRLETLLEGAHRPGHFQGVCEVVDRLLELVDPNRLYLGQKDYQQCMVLGRLLQLTGRERQTALRIVPTVREADGLAMSSRNLRLDPAQRLRATALYKALSYIRDHYPSHPFPALKETARKQLEEGGFEVDYVEIAEAGSLEPLEALSGEMVALVAASTGGIRLIDNMLLN